MSNEKTFMVETSAHHIHLTSEAVEELFGKGEVLNVVKNLSQPGMFSSDRRLTILNKAKVLNKKTGVEEEKEFKIENVAVLGPVRKANQVEVSLTDCRTLKVKNVPIRESGDLKGSAPITLLNPLNGKSINLSEGLIVAKRHIHMTENDAKNFGVKNGEIVSVSIKENIGRDAILSDVVIRVSNSFALAMHIDTDESNALGGLASGVVGTIVKVK